MQLDITQHLTAASRSVAAGDRDGVPTRAATIARTFPAPMDELWNAVTTVERIEQWFAPITGDLKLGGRYQVQGNAGGVVTACEPPSLFAATWELGGSMSWLEVALEIDAAGTRLTLTHDFQVSDHWTEYGPGAVGVGWEIGLLGLALHLAAPQEPRLDEEAFATSPEGKAFITQSSDGWCEAAIAFGTDPEAAREAATRTTAFYTGVDPADLG